MIKRLKTNHHFVPQFWQTIFYKFDVKQDGVYLDPTSFCLYKTPHTSKMMCKNSIYLIKDKNNQLSDRIENDLSKIEGDLSRYLKDFIEWLEKAVQGAEIPLNEKIMIRVYILFYLQLIRMPHILRPIFNNQKEWFNQLDKLIDQSSSIDEFYKSASQDFRDISLTQEGLDDLKQLSVSGEGEDYNIGHLIEIPFLLEIIKKDEEFYKIFRANLDKLSLGEEIVEGFCNTLQMVKLLNDYKKDVFYTDKPSFVFPMAVMPDKIEGQFYIAISPCFVMQFSQEEQKDNKLRFYQADQEKIKQINQELIQRTLKLKQDQNGYKHLSICIPCKQSKFEQFKKDYLPDSNKVNF